MDLYQGYEGDEQVGSPEQTVFTSYEEFENYKAMCQSVIEQAKAAERLASNPDFQTVVMKAYFEEEPQRLASLMASGKITDRDFEACAADLKSIGSLNQFLSQYVQKGIIAQEELASLEEAREAAIAEENGEEA